jgi:hypothetical protein
MRRVFTISKAEYYVIRLTMLILLLISVCKLIATELGIYGHPAPESPRIELPESLPKPTGSPPTELPDQCQSCGVTVPPNRTVPISLSHGAAHQSGGLRGDRIKTAHAGVIQRATQKRSSTACSSRTAAQTIDKDHCEAHRQGPRRTGHSHVGTRPTN